LQAKEVFVTKAASPNKGRKKSPPSLFIKPGFTTASSEQANFCTVTCYGVVVILYDSSRQIGGICHYLYPHWKKGKPSTPLFAGPAIISLIKMFHHRGSHNGDLRAQIIGGGCRPGDVKLIELSDQNIRMAYKLLEKQGINITKLEVGGYKCRRIVFNTKTGHTQISEADQIRSAEWIVMEDIVEKIV
jgi:chemotaxis protein CheD